MTTCSCIRGRGYDFTLDTPDKKTLIYNDLSDWMNEADGDYQVPDTYSVSILPPASSTPVTLILNVGSSNKITKEDLGSIRDGIYCFEVTSCGNTQKKSIGIFPSIECCIRQAYAVAPQSEIRKIEEVESYLRRASINVEMNNVKTAEKNLKIAKKLLENVKCDCNC